jgi:hypothetical protein
MQYLLSEIAKYVPDNMDASVLVRILSVSGIIFIVIFVLASISVFKEAGFSKDIFSPLLGNLFGALVLSFAVLVLAIANYWLSINNPALREKVFVGIKFLVVLAIFLWVLRQWPTILKKIQSVLPKHALEQPQPPILLAASMAPVRTMQLKLRPSRRSGGLVGNKIIFALDARVDLSPEEQQLVATFALGGIVVYESQTRKSRTEAAYSHFDSAAHTAGYDLSSAGRSLWRNARGLASAAMMALSLRVTINGLIRGQHIECKDLDELLGAEAAIVTACKNLKAYLDTALTFDGREEVVEF